MADMDFQFLRLEKPDVMRYLPKFLAEDEHFKRVQGSLSTEHEIQRQEIIDIASQFFVDTATWGLTAWEKVYQTNPPTGASIALRRSLLRAKMLGNRTMTKANLELLINQFVSNHDAYINEETAPGTFDIIVPSLVTYWDDLVNMLMEMVPAHLIINFGYEKDKTTGVIYNGAIPTIHKKYRIAPATIHDTTNESHLFAAGIASTHKKYAIQEVYTSGAELTSPVYAGGGVYVFKDFKVKEVQ